jgi:hypothetical protein
LSNRAKGLRIEQVVGMEAVQVSAGGRRPAECSDMSLLVANETCQRVKGAWRS